MAVIKFSFIRKQFVLKQGIIQKIRPLFHFTKESKNIANFNNDLNLIDENISINWSNT